ncbi:MAG: dihydrofolate reductase [Myxococcales bacterium]|nr:dihydrofolate reductase [Myxococcales bacterium]
MSKPQTSATRVTTAAGEASAPRDFACVVAMDAARGIGRHGDLPWPPLKGDLQHFARLTTTASPGRMNAVIMGRKTWASLPDKYRPLPRRHNVVISRQPQLLPPGTLAATSLPDALAKAAGLPTCDQIFVVGGGQIYAEAVTHPRCQHIYLTEIDATYDCDTTLVALPDFVPDLGWPAQSHSEGDVRFRISRLMRAVATTPQPQI